MTWLIFAMKVVLAVVVEFAWVSILDITIATDRIILWAPVTFFKRLSVAARDLPQANVSL